MTDIGGDESSLMMGAFDSAAFTGCEEDLILPGDSLFGFSTAEGVDASGASAADASTSSLLQGLPSSTASFQPSASLPPSAADISTTGNRSTPVKSTNSAARNRSTRSGSSGGGVGEAGRRKGPSLFQLVDGAVSGSLTRAAVPAERRKSKRTSCGGSTSTSTTAEEGQTDNSSPAASTSSFSAVTTAGSTAAPAAGGECRPRRSTRSSSQKNDGKPGCSGAENATVSDVDASRDASYSSRSLRKGIKTTPRSDKEAPKLNARRENSSATAAAEVAADSTSNRSEESLEGHGARRPRDAAAPRSSSSGGSVGGTPGRMTTRGSKAATMQGGKLKGPARTKDVAANEGMSLRTRRGVARTKIRADAAGVAAAALAAIGSSEASMPPGTELIPGFEDTIDAHFVKTLSQGSATQAAAPFADVEEDRRRADDSSPPHHGIGGCNGGGGNDDSDGSSSISLEVAGEDEPMVGTGSESLRAACGLLDEGVKKMSEATVQSPNPALATQPASLAPAPELLSSSDPSKPKPTPKPSAAVAPMLQAMPSDGNRDSSRSIGSTSNVDPLRAVCKRKFTDDGRGEDAARAPAPAIPRPPLLPATSPPEGKSVSGVVSASASSGLRQGSLHYGDKRTVQLAGPRISMTAEVNHRAGQQQTTNVTMAPAPADRPTARAPQPSARELARAAEVRAKSLSANGVETGPANDAEADGRRVGGESGITGQAVTGLVSAAAGAAAGRAPSAAMMSAPVVGTHLRLVSVSNAERKNAEHGGAAGTGILSVGVGATGTTGIDVVSPTLQRGLPGESRVEVGIAATSAAEGIGSAAAAGQETMAAGEARAENVEQEMLWYPHKVALRFTPRDISTRDKVAQRGYIPAQQLKAPLHKRVDAVFKFMVKKWSEVAYSDLNNIRILFEPDSPAVDGPVNHTYVWNAARGSESLVDLIESLPEATRVRVCKEAIVDLTYTFKPGPLGPREMAAVQPHPDPAAASTPSTVVLTSLPVPASTSSPTTPNSCLGVKDCTMLPLPTAGGGSKHPTTVAALSGVSVVPTAVAPSPPGIVGCSQVGVAPLATQPLVSRGVLEGESRRQRTVQGGARGATVAVAGNLQKTTGAGQTDSAAQGGGDTDGERLSAPKSSPSLMQRPGEVNMNPIVFAGGQLQSNVVAATIAAAAAIDSSFSVQRPSAVGCAGFPTGGEPRAAAPGGRASEVGFLATMHTAAVASGIGAGQTGQVATAGPETSAFARPVAMAANQSTALASGKDAVASEAAISSAIPPVSLSAQSTPSLCLKSVRSNDRVVSSDGVGMGSGADESDDLFMSGKDEEGREDAARSPLMGEETCMALFGGNGSEVELLVDSSPCVPEAETELVEPTKNANPDLVSMPAPASAPSLQCRHAAAGMLPAVPLPSLLSPRPSSAADAPNGAIGVATTGAESDTSPVQAATSSQPSTAQPVVSVGPPTAFVRPSPSPSVVTRLDQSSRPHEAATLAQNNDGVTKSRRANSSELAATARLTAGSRTAASEVLRDPSPARDRFSLPSKDTSSSPKGVVTSAFATFHSQTEQVESPATAVGVKGSVDPCAERHSGHSTPEEQQLLSPSMCISSLDARVSIEGLNGRPKKRQRTTGTGSSGEGLAARRNGREQGATDGLSTMHLEKNNRCEHSIEGGDSSPKSSQKVPLSIPAAASAAAAAEGTAAAAAAPAEENNSFVKPIANNDHEVVDNQVEGTTEGQPKITDSPAPSPPPMLAATPLGRTRSTTTRRRLGMLDAQDAGETGNGEHVNSRHSPSSKSLLESGSGSNGKPTSASLLFPPVGDTRTKTSTCGLDVSNLLDPASMAAIQAGYADTWTSFPNCFWGEEMSNEGDDGGAAGAGQVDDGASKREGSAASWLDLPSATGHTFQALSPRDTNLEVAVAVEANNDGVGQGVQQTESAGPAIEGIVRGDREKDVSLQGCGDRWASGENQESESRLEGDSKGSRASRTASMTSTGAVAASRASLPREAKSLPTLIRLGRSMTKGIATSPPPVAPTQTTSLGATADDGDELPSAKSIASSTRDKREAGDCSVGRGEEEKATRARTRAATNAASTSMSPTILLATAAAAVAPADAANAACGSGRGHSTGSKRCADVAVAVEDDVSLTSLTENSSASFRSITPPMAGGAAAAGDGTASFAAAFGRPRKRAKKGRIAPTLVTPLLPAVAATATDAVTSSISEPGAVVDRVTTAVGTEAFVRQPAGAGKGERLGDDEGVR